jgi:hypothetical protein
VALATTIAVNGHPIYTLNLSLSTNVAPAVISSELSSQLMDLSAQIRLGTESL